MSSTEIVSEQLYKIIKYRDRIPSEFWKTENDGTKYIEIHNWASGGYEWSAQRLDLFEDGTLRYAFDSGCSCYSAWNDTPKYNTLSCQPTKKSINVTVEEIEKIFGENNENRKYCAKPKDWKSETFLDDLVLLVKKRPSVTDVFTAKNAEVRRCLMKNVGYNKIKKNLNVVVIHTDKDKMGKPRELFKVQINNDTDCYVKVTDSSTDREYLLSVPIDMKTCHQAVAWTFDLREEEYDPIIET